MSHHRFIVGDVREALATLPPESVHCVVTSPPYFGLRDYGVAGQIGLEPSVEEYVATMVEVFRAVRRVLRKDGTCWLNIGDSYNGSGGSGGDYRTGGLKEGQPKFPGRHLSDLKPKDLIGMPWRVAFALQADGWYLRADVVWAKTAPMPESVTDRPTRSHEYVFLLAKSKRYFYDADAIAEPSVSVDPTPDTIRPSGERSPNGSERKRGPLNWGVTPIGIPGEYAGRVRSPNVGAGLLTRNRRDVWLLGPEPFLGAHFATMPQNLIEPPILAGCPEKVCAECGAPWTRIVVRSERSDRSDAGRSHSTAAQRRGKNPPPEKGWQTERADLGCRPTCDCGSQAIGGTVLDPFGGSGTVSLVARRLGRSSVYIDLNPDYLDMALERVGVRQQTISGDTFEVRDVRGVREEDAP